MQFSEEDSLSAVSSEAALAVNLEGIA
jgi:hypothetical protein